MGRLVRLVLGGALLAAGCGSGDSLKAPPDVGGPFGVCNGYIAEFDVASATHVEECSVLDEPTKPFHGGPHYPRWAAFQTYDFPLPHGYLMHDLEHGAIVFTYNCPNGCEAEVASAQALIDAQAVDPLCEGNGVSRRAILIPDPTLDVEWAASSWNFTLRADCFDPNLFGSFYKSHYGHGPEALCFAGVPFEGSPCPAP